MWPDMNVTTSSVCYDCLLHTRRYSGRPRPWPLASHRSLARQHWMSGVWGLRSWQWRCQGLMPAHSRNR